MRVTAIVGLGLLALCGCNILRPHSQPAGDAGLHVSGPTTAESLVSAVNENAARVQSIECRTVALDCRQGTEGASLQGMLVCQPRQRHFRMRANALGSTEVDLGSNEQEFWFWVKRAPEPYLFHCSHDDFAKGAAKLPFPFQPDWLIEAMGVAELDPAKKYEVIAYNDHATVDLVERTLSPQGQPVRKVTRFKGPPGHLVVTAHLLQDDSGKNVICAAYVRDVQRDPATGAMLPRQVQLVWPSQQIQMKMTLDHPAVNSPLDAQRTALLFTRPTLDGVRSYDLARGPDAPAGGPLRRTGGTYR